MRRRPKGGQCEVSSFAQKTENPLPQRVFSFSNSPGDQKGTKSLLFRMKYKLAHIYPTTLDLAIKKWHVEYRFLSPITGRKERFKVYKDINLQRPEDKAAYAIQLRDTVNAALKLGYDPFEEKAEAVAEQEQKEEASRKALSGDRSNFTIVQALNYFILEKTSEGKDPATIGRYKTGVNYLKDWLNTKELLLLPATEITATQVLTYLRENMRTRKWVNKTYNNHLGTLQTAFNLMSMRIHGIIQHNPIEGATLKDTLSKKHTAYTDQQLSWILNEVRAKKDSFMEGIVLSIYYACIRSKDELRSFKIKHILFDRDLIRLDAADTKNKTDEFIPLDPELKKFYMEQGFNLLPGDWFVFGNKGKPGPDKAGKNLYARYFGIYRNNLQLDDRYTLYGFKHTRNIHLAQEGIDPYALMQLNRHSSLDMLMNYLRDLGATINRKATVNSRKI